MPNVIVIAGANGAGKSTLAPYLLRDTFGIVEYVNADTIAAGLSAFAPENAAFEAGRIMLKRLDELAAARKDFAFETTLASRSYTKRLADLQCSGYHFHLFFLWLKSSQLAVERVRARVRLGGHDIPEETINRRYERGRLNFFNLYQPLADSWQVYNASPPIPQKIAFGDKMSGEQIVDRVIWKEMKN
ncbi:MAG: zeta toxin family protein [Acidobacteriota bacterium]|nr:zeta toxin family protein [Acidobacteriota bacterium]